MVMLATFLATVKVVPAFWSLRTSVQSDCQLVDDYGVGRSPLGLAVGIGSAIETEPQLAEASGCIQPTQRPCFLLPSRPSGFAELPPRSRANAATAMSISCTSWLRAIKSATAVPRRSTPQKSPAPARPSAR